MSSKTELITWNDACLAYDREDYDMSLNLLDQIADSAKIHFNIGVILAGIQEHEAAIKAYLDALSADQYFAVAYFQKGVSEFLLGDFENAIEDFNDALLYLRGNILIDYKQIGLDYKLYSCEVLYNRGLCHLYLDDEQAGAADLYSAQKEKQTPDHEVINQAIEEGIEGLSVFSLPPGLIYRPPESKIKNSQKVDYLGSSKLIAAVKKNDMFVGFKGAYERKMSVSSADQNDLSAPASMRGRSMSLSEGSSSNPYNNNQFTRKRSQNNGNGAANAPPLPTSLPGMRRPVPPSLSRTTSGGGGGGGGSISRRPPRTSSDMSSLARAPSQRSARYSMDEEDEFGGVGGGGGGGGGRKERWGK